MGSAERRATKRWGGAAAVLLAVSLAGPGRAAAGSDYFAAKPKAETVRYSEARPRTPRQRMLIGGLLGGAVVIAGIGLYFHLDSRSASDEISALSSTHEVWSRDRQETYDRAERSRTGAIVGYTGGGLLLLAAAVTFYLTDPGFEVRDVQIPKPAPPPRQPGWQGIEVSPLGGGAMLEGAWRF